MTTIKMCIVVFIALMSACALPIDGSEPDAGPCSRVLIHEAMDDSIDIIPHEPAQWSRICVTNPQPLRFWVARDDIANSSGMDAYCLTSGQATSVNLVPGLTYYLAMENAPETVTIELSSGCAENIEVKDLHGS